MNAEYSASHFLWRYEVLMGKHGEVIIDFSFEVDSEFEEEVSDVITKFD